MLACGPPRPSVIGRRGLPESNFKTASREGPRKGAMLHFTVARRGFVGPRRGAQKRERQNPVFHVRDFRSPDKTRAQNFFFISSPKPPPPGVAIVKRSPALPA